MPSFFLSETCKYLFLLFADEGHWLRGGWARPGGGPPFVLSTEAHPFPVVADQARARRLLVAPVPQTRGAPGAEAGSGSRCAYAPVLRMRGGLAARMRVAG